MRSKYVTSTSPDAQPAALHAARLAMLKQLHIHLPIEEAKIWSNDSQTDTFSISSMDQRSVATGITGFASVPENHYRVPKKKLSMPLFFRSNQEYSNLQTLRRDKFSTFSLRSPKKKSAAGRFVLHLKRTFSSRNLLFQRPISSASHYKENLYPSFTTKELPKYDQFSSLTIYATNTLTNPNQPFSKKTDENSELSQLKKKIAALEILETQNGKENQPLSEDRTKSLTIMSEENNNDNIFITALENDNIPPSYMSRNTSMCSIDHRDNAGPVQLFTNEISPSKLNCNIYRSRHQSPYDQESGIINFKSPLYSYRRNSPTLSAQLPHSPPIVSCDTPSSRLEEVLYSKPHYNIRSPSGLEKAVNFNYGGIDEWRREIRNSMRLERKKKR